MTEDINIKVLQVCQLIVKNQKRQDSKIAAQEMVLERMVALLGQQNGQIEWLMEKNKPVPPSSVTLKEGEKPKV